MRGVELSGIGVEGIANTLVDAGGVGAQQKLHHVGGTGHRAALKNRGNIAGGTR